MSHTDPDSLVESLVAELLTTLRTMDSRSVDAVFGMAGENWSAQNRDASVEVQLIGNKLKALADREKLDEIVSRARRENLAWGEQLEILWFGQKRSRLPP